MNTLREIAKFASGAEAFHALVHFVLWFTGTTLNVFFPVTPTISIVSAVINAVIALALGFFAWGGMQILIGSATRPSVPARSAR